MPGLRSNSGRLDPTVYAGVLARLATCRGRRGRIIFFNLIWVIRQPKLIMTQKSGNCLVYKLHTERQDNWLRPKTRECACCFSLYVAVFDWLFFFSMLFLVQWMRANQFISRQVTNNLQSNIFLRWVRICFSSNRKFFAYKCWQFFYQNK